MCFPVFDEIFPSAYELYADLSQGRASQSKDKSPKDDSPPPNTEYSQKNESSWIEDKDSMKINDNSKKQKESSQEKEGKPQKKNQSLLKDWSKSKKGLWKCRKAQEADNSSKMAQRFKETFSRPNVKVHFVGVWCVPIVMVVVMGL